MTELVPRISSLFTSSPSVDDDARADDDDHLAKSPPSVLVVEDDGMLREALVEALRDERYVVASARDGAEALAILENGFRPSLVLLDLWLPHITGAQALRSIRADSTLHEIPVVVVTAADVIDETIARDADAVVKKPLDLHRLLDVVDRLRN